MSLLAAALVLGPQPPQANIVSLLPAKVVVGLRPVAFAPSPTGSTVAVSMEDGTVRIIDAKTRQTVANLATHPQPAYAIAWSPDGTFVATGDETARIWVENVRTKTKLREYRTHTRGIQKLSFNSTNNAIVSTGKDDVIKVYNILDPAPKEKISILGSGANFYGAVYSPIQSSTFATGILGPGGRIYDTVSGKVLGFLTDPTSQGVFDVAYNANGTRVATAGREGNVVLWDPVKKSRLGAMKGHKDFVMYVAFSPNGKLVASGSTDATVRLWNLYTMQTVAEIPGQSYVGSPVAFTADGSNLLTVNDAGYLQINPLSPAQTGAAPVKAPAKPPKKATKKATKKKR
ncbi:MAG TPA: WD40 repeat domain-containing protein [Fimbriimonas sp.]